MTGLLIFSGLFSASLTAFIIESYKTLQQDPADTTNDLLKQMISLQPASTIPVYEAPPSFEVTTAALACNILWFISLALSLTCSLLATLVDQWAREFLHKTDIRPAPVIRARVLSFLYRGLQDFHMHAVVDTMPFLLHFSLFLFFGGLIPFLLPINVAVAGIVAVILGTFLGLYIFLTVLPVIRRACPYRTPLSSIAWKLARYINTGIAISGRWYNGVRLARMERPHKQPRNANSDAVSRSMTDAALDEALKDCQDRDVHAMQWTLKSLTDDNELLPFVEAIPDLVCGHKGFRRDNDHLLLPLLNTSDPQLSLSTRIVDLLRRCDNYPQEVIPGTLNRERIQTACLKAIWALGMMPNPKAFEVPHLVWFDSSVLELLDSRTLDTHYTLTAGAAVLYNWTNTILACITEMRRIHNDHVVQAGCQLNAGPLQTISNMMACFHVVMDMVDGLDERYWALGDIRGAKNHLWKLSAELTRASAGSAAENATLLIALTDIAQSLDIFRDEMLFFILARLLFRSLRCMSRPYEFSTTCQKLLSDRLHSQSSTYIEGYFLESVVPDLSSVAWMSSDDIHDLDHIMNVILQVASLCSFDISGTFSLNMFRYIAKRKSDKAILHIMKNCDITQLLSIITRDLWYSDESVELLETIYIMCRLLAAEQNTYKTLKADLHGWLNNMYPHLLEYSTSSSEIPAIMAIVSHHLLCYLEKILGGISDQIHPPMAIDILHVSAILNKVHNHPLLKAHLPGRAALDLSLGDHQLILDKKGITYDGQLLSELKETQLLIISQLLSAYSTEKTPGAYNGYEAVKILCSGLWMWSGALGVRPKIQLAFANGAKNIMQCLVARPDDIDFQNIFVKVWELPPYWLEWLDDAKSAYILSEVMQYYVELHMNNTWEGHHFNPVKRAQRILARCSEVLNAAGQDAEELESSLRQESMLLNFIRPP